MRLLGLSSLDTLLSLLLVELTWWGTIFFGQTLPYFMLELYAHFHPMSSWIETDAKPSEEYESERHTLGGDVEIQFTEYNEPTKAQKWTTGLTIFSVFVVLLFFRLKAPLLLLVTVLKNRVNEHCQLLRIWFRLTIILDVTLFVFVGFLNASTWDMKHILTKFFFALLPFLIFRLIFWSLAKEMVDELSVKGNSLFPTVGCKGVFMYLGSNVSNALQVFLTWEILTNAAILFFSIFFSIELLFFDLMQRYPWAVISSDNYSFTIRLWGPTGVLLCFALTMVIICITTAQLIGVHKEWKSAMKFLVVLYILFGFIGPLVLVGLIMIQYFDSPFQIGKNDSGLRLVSYIGYAFSIILDIGQTILRLFLIEFTFKFFQRRSAENEEQSALRQPLLREEFLNEKQVE